MDQALGRNLANRLVNKRARLTDHMLRDRWQECQLKAKGIANGLNKFDWRPQCMPQYLRSIRNRKLSAACDFPQGQPAVPKGQSQLTTDLSPIHVPSYGVALHLGRP